MPDTPSESTGLANECDTKLCVYSVWVFHQLISGATGKCVNERHEALN